MFCTITSLVVHYTETSVDFCVPLRHHHHRLEICLPPSPRLQGLLLCGRIHRSIQPAVPLSHLELICHHFHHLGNTSFSILITRTGFWDSRILPSSLLEQFNHNFACRWHCSFFHGSWGPVPGCSSSSSRPFGTCFIKPTTHSLCVSSSLLVNLPLTPWLTASLSALLPVAGCERVTVSCFKHTLLNASLALL